MTGLAGSPHPATARELKQVLDAERAGEPFLLYRDSNGQQRLVELGTGAAPLTVGRSLDTHVPLSWDSEVSAVHTELEWMGGEWTVVDDGLSTNGTFVNAVRVSGRHRLRDGDTLRLGQTTLVYRSPGRQPTRSTSPAQGTPTLNSVTETQRRVLAALCRPYKESVGFASPATNQQIAQEVFLSVDAVKTHLRSLFHTFAIEDLPQNQKRARLVECALQWGIIAKRDL